MANSTVLVTFSSNPSPFTVLNIASSEHAFDMDETFFARFSSGITTIGNNNFVTRVNYRNAVDLDYNTANFYTITEVFDGPDPAVLITALNEGVVFSIVSNTTAGAVTTVINNVPATPVITIDSIDFVTATIEDVCTHIGVEVTTSPQADEMTLPVVIDPVNTNPITFDWPRQSSWDITEVIHDTLGTTTDNTTQITPDVLSDQNITINIVKNLSGGTATVNVTNTSQLDLEYSLDNVIFQSSNVFSGQPVGAYTAYVRDQFGCTVSKPFIISDLLAVTEPYEFVSNQNSIRYAKKVPATETSGLLDDDQTYEIVKYQTGDDFLNIGAAANATGQIFVATGQVPTDWTNGSALRQLSQNPCGDYQNSDTLLSCQEPVEEEVRYKAVQDYNSCDIITTQFKSNYDNIEAITVDPNGVETVLPLTKVTDNLEREDRRDANIFSLGGGKTGLYYTSGNLYDFTTGLVTGTYALNGNLPEYGVVGTYVEIIGIGTFLIEEVTINEIVNAKVLVFDFVYAGSPDIKVAKVKYSVANFEVYEYTTDMSFYIDQRISVKLHMDHPLDNFPDVDYVSEIIDVKILHTTRIPEQLLEIEYYNTDNGEILYIGNDGNLRIKHKIRVKAQSVSISSDVETEIQKTDTTTIMLNASIYQGDEYVFGPVPTEMARRLRNVLAHNIVKINQAGSVLNGEPELERLGESNLYTVTAKMLRTGKIFNTEIQGVGNEVPQQSEIPALLTGQLGFVKA